MSPYFGEKFVKRERIILTGDSAGGFFTMTTWFRMKSYFKENQIKPALLSFIYPAFGYRFDSPRYSTKDILLAYATLMSSWSTPLIWSKITKIPKIIMCLLKNSTLIKHFQLP